MKTIDEAAKEHSRKQPYGVWNDNAIESFKAGVEFAQQWIPVEEELPPINEPITIKYILRNGFFDYWSGTFHTEIRRLHFLETHLKFTHWRPIELK